MRDAHSRRTCATHIRAHGTRAHARARPRTHTCTHTPARAHARPHQRTYACTQEIIRAYRGAGPGGPAALKPRGAGAIPPAAQPPACMRSRGCLRGGARARGGRSPAPPSRGALHRSRNARHCWPGATPAGGVPGGAPSRPWRPGPVRDERYKQFYSFSSSVSLITHRHLLALGGQDLLHVDRLPCRRERRRRGGKERTGAQLNGDRKSPHPPRERWWRG